ncbi:ArnT family glycosyltransferase [Chloroflexota bacterium]
MARQEAAQPPLYYVLAALVLAPVDTSPAPPGLHVNPYVDLGYFDSVNNFNAFAHTPEETWPWSGFVLAVHAVRFLSVALGLGTLACIHASGRLLWVRRTERALLATALVAFLPQFIFLHSAVTNDTLIIFLCSAALWQMVRLWMDKVTPWRLLALGLTIGLAALSKTTGQLLLVLSAVTVMFLVWRDAKWRLLVQYLALLVVPVALLSGWMYWRNWLLYGDISAVNVFVQLAGGDRHFTVRQALADLGRVWQSSIAVFGWMNVVAPTWVYAVWNGLVVLGVLGLVVKGLRVLIDRLSQGRQKRSALDLASVPRRWLLPCLLALWPLLVFGAWLQFAMRTPADQGRLLFTAILPVALALASGLGQWSRRWSYPVVSLLTLVTSVYCVLFLLPQAYVQPTTIEAGNIPPDATRLNYDMGLGVELVASEVPSSSAHPGDLVDLTLYWRNQAVTTTAAVVVPKILGREHAQIGRLPDAHHGGGLYPSTLWPPDKIVRERIRLPLENEIATPTQARLIVELAGQEGFVEVGSIKVVPRTWPRPNKTILAHLGDGIVLSEAGVGATTVSQGSTVPVNLRWQISQAPGKDLVTFVHLGDPTQPPLAQADGLALGGSYPPRLWAAGEVFDDRYDLQLPEDTPQGRYPVHVGLYDPDTGQRVPVWIDDVRQPHDAFLLAWLTVE